MMNRLNRISLFLSLLLLYISLSPAVLAADNRSEEQSQKERSAEDFKDLAGLPDEDKELFDVLIKAGLFEGVAEDQFGLHEKMTRAQFAKVAALLFSLSVDDTLEESSYSDVSGDDPANGFALPFIEALKEAGLTNGAGGDGTLYNPSGEVTRQELAAFLVRGLSLEEEAGKEEPLQDDTVAPWAEGYVSLVLVHNIMKNEPDGKFAGNVPATRQVLAQAAYEVREQLKESEGSEGPGKISLVEAKPIGASLVSVTLNAEIDSEKAELEITKDGSEIKGSTEWDEDGKSAVIELDKRLEAGEYKVKLTGLEEDEVDKTEIGFSAEDEQFNKLEFDTASDILPQSKVRIDFKVTNQYGERTDQFPVKIMGLYGNGMAPVRVPGKQALQLDLTEVPSGTPIPITLVNEESLTSVNKTFKVGDPPVAAKIEIGDLKLAGPDEKVLKPGSTAYLLFTAYDQYGHKLFAPEILNGGAGLSKYFTGPQVFQEIPDGNDYIDADNDGYPELQLKVIDELDGDAEVTVRLVANGSGQSVSKELKVVVPKVPATVEFSPFTSTLYSGDEEKFVSLTVKDSEGNELSPDDIVEAETSGKLVVYGGGGLVLEADPPTRTDYSVTPNIERKAAVQARGSDKGKIRIDHFTGWGPMSVTAYLPAVNQRDTLQLTVLREDERKPAAIKVDGKDTIVLLPSTKGKVKFKVFDQYDSSFSTSLPDYRVEFKLTRMGGSEGAAAAAGAITISDASPSARGDIRDISGKDIEFTADPLRTGTYRLTATLQQLNPDGSVLSSLSSASASVEVIDGRSKPITYELDISDTLFAAGKLYHERGVISTVTDATYLMNYKDKFSSEIKVEAKDSLGRSVALPSNIIESVTTSNPRVIGHDGINRMIGLDSGTAYVSVSFRTANGSQTLFQEVEVKEEYPSAQELKADKKTSEVDSGKLNGLLPWDGDLMKKVSVKDQYGNSFDNDKLLTEYNDIFNVMFIINNVKYKPGTVPGTEDRIYIGADRRIVYIPGSGNPDNNNLAGFTITAVSANGKSASTEVDVE